MSRKPYQSDICDEEWNFVVPCLTLIDEEAPRQHYSLREMFNALCADQGRRTVALAAQ